MKRILSVLFLLVMTVSMVMADKISEEKAYDIAARFMNGATGGVRKAKAGDSVLRLVKSTTGYYAFNRGAASGFVIVAADDRAVDTVLGYADEGSLEADQMPANLKWWLGEYDRQIAYAAAHPAAMAPAKVTARAAIEPLMKSQWGQDDPYNLDCPQVNGENCPTGCVATAVAQIMYYHKWPDTGTGTYSYRWRNGYSYQTLSVDFSKASYDWDAMTDTYGSGSTEASRAAVAQLMYHVGVASEMAYQLDGSGTGSNQVAVGLTRNFKYDKGLQLAFRDYYGLDEWTDLLYGELADGRPVYYSGTNNTNAGHAFVADGYRDGYFHINWGWDGVSNGYFLISALTPSIQGTGGSDSGYNYDQDAMIGLRPAQSGSSYKALVYGENFTASTSSLTLGSSATFYGPFYSMALTSTSFYMGIKVVDESGQAVCLGAGSDVSVPSYSGVSYYTVSTSGFPRANGTYKVYPIYRQTGTDTWQDLHTKRPSANSYLVATVSDGTVTFRDPAVTPGTLRATSLTPGSKLYAGQTCSVSASLTNTGNEYYDYVYVAFKNPSTGQAVTGLQRTNRLRVDLSDGMTQTVDFSVTVPSTVGDYNMVLQDAQGNDISDAVAVTVNAVPTGTLSMQVFKRLRVENADHVSPSDVHFTAQLSCLRGFYSNLLVAYVFPEDGSTSVAYTSAPIVIGEGDKLDIDMHGAFTGLEEGKRYFLALAYLSTSNQTTLIPSVTYGYNRAYFTVDSQAAGIEALSAPASSSPILIYSSAGVLVDRQLGSQPCLDRLPKGLYIIRQGNTTRQVMKR